MADELQLSFLKQGAMAWNEWRHEHLLNRADLRAANLSGADLSKANIFEATLFSVVLDGVNFERATVGRTLFGSFNLSSCSGLDSVVHLAPATLGVDSIILSKGRIPEIFLRGVGLPDEWIAYIPSLVGDGIQFFSCFISYSSVERKKLEKERGKPILKLIPVNLDGYILTEERDFGVLRQRIKSRRRGFPSLGKA